MMKIMSLLAGVLLLFTGCNSNNKDKQHVADFMKKTDILQLRESAPKLIGKDWMMITAGDSTKFNTMTASWGTLGELWGKPVAIVFVRPQRYTFEFLESNDYFTLSFFDEEYRDALNIIGTKSGRNTNKIEEAGISPVKTEYGMSFGEARMVIECRKIYADFLNGESFIEKGLDEKHYRNGDYHKMYVGEIVNVWKR